MDDPLMCLPRLSDMASSPRRRRLEDARDAEVQDRAARRKRNPTLSEVLGFVSASNNNSSRSKRMRSAESLPPCGEQDSRTTTSACAYVNRAGGGYQRDRPERVQRDRPESFLRQRRRPERRQCVNYGRRRRSCTFRRNILPCEPPQELLRGCLHRQAFCGRASNHDRGSPKQVVKRVLGSKSLPLYFYFALRQKLSVLLYLFLIPSALFPIVVQGIGFVDGPHPLHCPVKFEELFDAVQTGASLYNENRIKESKETLTGYLQKWANADPLVGMECSLGMAAAYRTLTFAYCANPRTNNRRAYQIGLRILHQAMNWITHVFVKSQHDADMIDGSKWPITIQQINDELTIIQNVLKQDGISNGHQLHPRFAKDLVQLNWQPKSGWVGKNRHDIKIVSLCAYPEDHVLPRYATSNHQIYAKKHGYSYYVERSRLDKDRPHAWGKIKVVEQQLSQPDGPEWVMWFDCDTYFMNMTVTIESVLYRYAGIPRDELAERERAAASGRAQQPRFETRSKIHSTDDIVLDPSVHLIIAEDNAMLNSGTFFIRKSEWSVNLMRQVWGDPKTSPWIDHPWWENAALTWYFLKDVPRTFVNDDTLESWPTLSSGGASGIQLGGSAGGGYQQQKTFAELGEEEKNYWISKEMENIYTPEVRIAPQHVFNSYHPVTSRFQHDTWEPGKYVLAFNGVLSSTSPTVIRLLYGNYYREACKLNRVEDQCVPIVETLPWLQDHASLHKELFKDEDKGKADL